MIAIDLLVLEAAYERKLRIASDRIRLLEEEVAALQRERRAREEALTVLGASKLPHWWKPLVSSAERSLILHRHQFSIEARHPPSLLLEKWELRIGTQLFPVYPDEILALERELVRGARAHAQLEQGPRPCSTSRSSIR